VKKVIDTDAQDTQEKESIAADEQQSSGISRRNALKGAALAGLGALSLGALGACASPEGGSDGAAAGDDTAWDYEADVVVVGFGAAGGTTAVAAERAGSSVIVVEVDPFETRLSNSRMSGGLTHCPDGDPAALKQYLQGLMDGGNLPGMFEGEFSPLFLDGVLDKFVEYLPKTVEFVQSLDPEIQYDYFGGAAHPSFPGAEASGYKVYMPTFGGNRETNRHGMDKKDSHGGASLVMALENELFAKEDLVTFLWNTRARTILRSASGEIIGITAGTDGGEGDTIRIKARKGVVLTAGGYEYNEEMRRAFATGPAVNGWTFYGTSHNRGDGIRMGIEVGAQLVKAGKVAGRMIWACPDLLREGSMPQGFFTDSIHGSPGTFLVNSYGNRWIDENKLRMDPTRYFTCIEAVHMDINRLDYPNVPSYVIFDDTYIHSRGAFMTDPWEQLPFAWDDENQEAVNRGYIFKADTIEELAELIKAHELNADRMVTENLVATLNQYNEICETGVDTAFGRQAVMSSGAGSATSTEVEWVKCATPPFYAWPQTAGGSNTKGSIQTDGERRVVDWDNQPIPRLYSAGEMSSAFKWVYQSGGNVTECLVNGQVAGKNVAALEPWDAA
jgi:succinate dehydrogenase/fumarate reductase flavoprotein subunit